MGRVAERLGVVQARLRRRRNDAAAARPNSKFLFRLRLRCTTNRCVKGTWQYLSANILNNPSKAVVVADELESFFHIIIYYAVRFVPHNLNPGSVGTFLVNYFDGFTHAPDGGYRCGLAKANAMRTGEIQLSEYNQPSGTLVFYMPPDKDGIRKFHPINKVLEPHPQWFKAYYALHSEKPECEVELLEDVKASVLSLLPNFDDFKPPSTPQLSSPHASGASGSPADLHLDLTTEHPPSEGTLDASAAAKFRALEQKKIEEDAAKLSSHDAMRILLWDILGRRAWPDSDKGTDLKPAVVPKTKGRRKAKGEAKKGSAVQGDPAPQNALGTQSDTTLQGDSAVVDPDRPATPTAAFSHKRFRDESDSESDSDGDIPQSPLAKRTRSSRSRA